MTLTTTTSRYSYAGNGVTTVFSFPAYFLASGDLVVILKNDSTGVETVKVLTTHYTVAGAGVQAGGSVTMLTPPATGETLTIYRDPAATQGLDLVENDSSPAESNEMAFDRAMMVLQRVKDLASRSVRLSEGYADIFDPTLPPLITPATALVFNAAGDGFDPDGPTVTDIADAADNAAAAAASAAAASASQSAAASSASSAAAAVSSVFFRDIVFKTFADSPITMTAADRGKLYAFDCTGGAIAVTLPAVAGLDLTSAFVIGFKKTDSSGNAVTINRASTDTIDGATTKVLSSQGASTILVPDTDPAPDVWLGFDATAVATPETTQSYELKNLGLSVTVAANAVTVALKQADGSTNPAAGSGAVKIGFRSSTATSGGYVERSVTGALSAVISSGSTLGFSNGVAGKVHWYAIDNAGTPELAFSRRGDYDNGALVSTTAEGGAGAADSGSALYSTTARSNVACRWIGYSIFTEATAGTWATAASLTSLLPVSNSEITEDTSITLTPNNFGTTTLQSTWVSEVAKRARIRGYFKSGTVAAAVASFTLPTGIEIDNTKYASTSQVQRVGQWTRISTGASVQLEVANAGPIFYDGSDTTKVYLGGNSGSDVITKDNASAFLANNDGVTFWFEITVK